MQSRAVVLTIIEKILEHIFRVEHAILVDLRVIAPCVVFVLDQLLKLRTQHVVAK